jgi:hypothetical protein
MRGLASTWGLAVVGVVAAAIGCAAPTRSIDFQLREPGPATPDGLSRVEGRDVSAAFMRPETVFGAYDEVAVDPLRISHKEGTRPLDHDSMERLGQIYGESFNRQLGRSGSFRVVSERGPRTLRVTGRIVNLDVRMGSYRGGEKQLVLDAGEMTLVLDVRDSQTGESLARIADRRRIRPKGITGPHNAHRGGYAGFESSPVNVWGAMREVVDDWARILRQGLDDLHALAPVPIPDELGDG